MEGGVRGGEKERRLEWCCEVSLSPWVSLHLSLSSCTVQLCPSQLLSQTGWQVGLNWLAGSRGALGQTGRQAGRQTGQHHRKPNLSKCHLLRQVRQERAWTIHLGGEVSPEEGSVLSLSISLYLSLSLSISLSLYLSLSLSLHPDLSPPPTPLY